MEMLKLDELMNAVHDSDVGVRQVELRRGSDGPPWIATARWYDDKECQAISNEPIDALILLLERVRSGQD